MHRMLSPGRSFGRYEIGERLGSGGTGTVYRARDLQLDREVALKIPRLDLHADPGAADRFLRQARLAAQIDHTHVCSVYDAGEIEGICYLAMRLVRGPTLADWMSPREVSGREAAEIVRKLALAVQQIHQRGIIHRDIKATNIVIDEAGEPLLMDFGLARWEDRPGHHSSSSLWLGGYTHMTPEQLDGKPADRASDIYCLGVVLFQLLTGRPPYEGTLLETARRLSKNDPPRPSRFKPSIDPRLEGICLRAMAREPTARYASAGELARALEDLATGFPASRPMRSRRTLRAAVWAIFGAATVFVLAQVIQRGSVRPGAGFFRGTSLAAASKSVFDPSVPTVRTLALPPGTTGMTISPGGELICVGRGPVPGSPRRQDLLLHRVDAPSGRTLASYDLSESGQPTGASGDVDVVASPDGRYLYTAGADGGHLVRVDQRQDGKRTRLPLPENLVPKNPQSQQLAITPDGRTLVLGVSTDGSSSNQEGSRVFVINAAEGAFALRADVRLPDGLLALSGLAVAADNRHAYVIAGARGSPAQVLSEVRIEPDCGVARQLTFPQGDLRGVAASDRFGKIFVSNAGEKRIDVVDRASFRVISAIDLDGHLPGALTLDDRAELLAALCPATGDLFLIDPAEQMILTRVRNLDAAVSKVQLATDVGIAALWDRRGSAVSLLDLHRVLTQIVFASDRDGGSYQLYTRNAQGDEVRCLTENFATEGSPCWSPDGRRIAFVSDRDGPFQIYIMDRAGRIRMRLDQTDPPMAGVGGTTFAWSPDGTRMAFLSRDEKSVRIVEVATGEVQTVIDGPLGENLLLKWSLAWRGSDDRILLIATHNEWRLDCGLFAVDWGSGEARLLIDDSGTQGCYTDAVPSPDGRWIALARTTQGAARQFQLLLCEADGNGVRQLTNEAGAYCGQPAWCGDSRTLVASIQRQGERKLTAFTIDTRERWQLTGDHGNDVEPDVCQWLRRFGREESSTD